MQREKEGFIWIPKPKNTRYFIYIDGVDMTQECITSEWTKGLVGFDCGCKIRLIDTDGTWANKYIGGEIIILYLDFSDGSTKQWAGKLTKPKRMAGYTYYLEIIGEHYQAALLDINVTKSCDGTLSSSDILKAIIDEFLVGYTYTNVVTSTVYPIVNWNNKPFMECVVELCSSTHDAFVDDDKDFHFFEKGSVNNDDEALVWTDNILNINGLGTDNVEIKNRIKIEGQDEYGFAVLYVAEDLASQAQHGIKEKIIKDQGIKDFSTAKSIGEAELALAKELQTSGTVNTIIIPDIKLGQMTYIIHSPLQIHDRYRPVKYTHKLPEEHSEVIIDKERNIPQVLKSQATRQIGLEPVANPFGMKKSLNLSFKDSSMIDESLSDHITTTNGYLAISEGSNANMVSIARTETTDITAVHIEVSGDYLSGTKYSVSTIEDDWTDVVAGKKYTVPSGAILRLKIQLASANTIVYAAVVNYE